MKKNPKLELKRHSIRSLSPREMRETAGGGVIHFVVLPTMTMPSGCCLPPPPEEM